VLHLIVLVLRFKAHALIDCNAATEAGPFESAVMKLWIGSRLVSGAGNRQPAPACQRDPGWAAAKTPGTADISCR